MKNNSVQEIRENISFHLRLIRKHYYGAKKAVQAGIMYHLSPLAVNAIETYRKASFGYYMCDFISLSTHWRTDEMVEFLDRATYHEISFDI